MAKRAPRKGEGRPSIYTKELAKNICLRLSQGESLLKICREEGMPTTSTVYLWLLDNVDKEFSDNYVKARQMQADLKFEEMEEISDEAFNDIIGDDKSDSARINARKLQVDTKKWILSKMLPKKYGDKLDLTSGGDKLPVPIINLGGKEEKEPQ